jgi:hypothetical protein
MSNIEVSVDSANYRPGETVRGQVRWDLHKLPRKGLFVRLAWYTQGIGSQDSGVAAETNLSIAREQGSERFSLVMPDGPFSFSGKLITLQWIVEASASKTTGQAPIVLSLTGEEVQL